MNPAILIGIGVFVFVTIICCVCLLLTGLTGTDAEAAAADEERRRVQKLFQETKESAARAEAAKGPAKGPADTTDTNTDTNTDTGTDDSTELGETVIEGCTVESATNYLPSATFDDGTCEYVSIGDTHEGGIVFWLDGNGGGLIAAPTDQSIGSKIADRFNMDAPWEGPGPGWGCMWTTVPGANEEAIGKGKQNTDAIVNTGCLTNMHTQGTMEGPGAAEICYNLSLGGYDDWFLPSQEELREMLKNIGPSEDEVSDMNTLGVAPVDGMGVGKLLGTSYWSSTQQNYNNARTISHLNIGGRGSKHKDDGNPSVRAVRAF